MTFHADWAPLTNVYATVVKKLTMLVTCKCWPGIVNQKLTMITYYQYSFLK